MDVKKQITSQHHKRNMLGLVYTEAGEHDQN